MATPMSSCSTSTLIKTKGRDHDFFGAIAEVADLEHARQGAQAVLGHDRARVKGVDEPLLDDLAEFR